MADYYSEDEVSKKLQSLRASIGADEDGTEEKENRPSGDESNGILRALRSDDPTFTFSAEEASPDPEASSDEAAGNDEEVVSDESPDIAQTPFLTDENDDREEVVFSFGNAAGSSPSLTFRADDSFPFPLSSDPVRNKPAEVVRETTDQFFFSSVDSEEDDQQIIPFLIDGKPSADSGHTSDRLPSEEEDAYLASSDFLETVAERRSPEGDPAPMPIEPLPSNDHEDDFSSESEDDVIEPHAEVSDSESVSEEGPEAQVPSVPIDLPPSFLEGTEDDLPAVKDEPAQDVLSDLLSDQPVKSGDALPSAVSSSFRRTKAGFALRSVPRRARFSMIEDEDAADPISVTSRRALVASFRSALASLVWISLFAILIGLWECLPSLRNTFLRLTGWERFYGSAMLIDAELLALSLAGYIPSVRRAIVRLKEKILTPELYVSALTALSFLYLLIGGVVLRTQVFFALPCACLLFFSQLSRFFLTVSALRSAEVCLDSTDGVTAVLRRIGDLQDVSETFSENDPEKMVLSEARFYDKDTFLSRLDDEYVSHGAVKNLMIASVAISFSVGLLFLFLGGFSVRPVAGFLMTAATVFPVSLMMIHSWMPLRAGSALRRRRMVAAGETALYEMTDASVFTFTDSEAFAEGVQILKIKLYQEKRVDTLFEKMSSLFRLAGGPLSGVFSVSGQVMSNAPQVYIRQIEEDGIHAIIDGEMYYVGRGSFMERHHVAFYYDSEDEVWLRDPGVMSLYVACDSIPHAKLYLRYRFSDVFLHYLSGLSARGIRVLIRSADPNISTEMVGRIANLPPDTVGVIRAKIGASAPVPETTSGLVSYRIPPASMYAACFLCKSYRRLQEFLPWLSVLTVPFCAAVCAFSRMVGAPLRGWMLVFCVLAQMISVIPSVILTEIRLRKLYLGENEK